MDWNVCLKQREAKLVQPDLEMASSLEKTSANKYFSSNLLILKEETAASKISLSYDSVRERVEAAALRRGFKIYNHACYTGSLTEIMKKEEIADEFDVLRSLR